MNPENFAEWLQHQNYRVLRTVSSYWYEASPRVYQAFPYHWVIQPSEEELLDFLVANRAVALRYSTSLDASSGAISYHAVHNQPDYELVSLDRRTRQNIRKGLRNCQVEQIPLQRMAEHGYELELDTASRQGRRPSITKEAWRQRYLSAGELPGFEAWGALVEGRLVATLLSFQMDDCCELISQQCHQDFLKARVNNALTFVVTQTMVNHPAIRSIFYTLQSLDAPSSVDAFKFRMGFTAKPVRQRVVFHPWAAPFANRLSHGMVLRLMKRSPGDYRLAKAEGMLRFHQQGLLPIEEQDWPEILVKNKDQVLKDL